MTDGPAGEGERARASARVQIDEPHVRVTEYRFAPGTATGFHRHAHDYVVVPILGGTLTMEEPSGHRRQARLTAGESYARPAGVEHDVINASDSEIAFIEIELKR